MASTTGTARTATQASWRPTLTGWAPEVPRDEVQCTRAFGVVGVGLKTHRKVTGEPSAMPPAIPPEIWLIAEPGWVTPSNPVP